MKILPIGHLVKTNPKRTQSKPIKVNKMSKQTQYEPNQTQFQKGQNELKLLFNSALLKLTAPSGPEKTNPIQSQFARG